MNRRRFVQSLGAGALGFGMGASGMAQAEQAGLPQDGFRGNQPKSAQALSAWHKQGTAETAIDVDMPIVDPHHHLYGVQTDKTFYRLEDLAADLGSGHKVLGTVYVEAYGAGWRSSGPQELRSVGEVERIVALTTAPLNLPQGQCEVAAGIVSNVDLTLGASVENVLAAHREAGGRRLSGIRHMAVFDEGPIGRLVKVQPAQYLLRDDRFREGFAKLEPAGLAFDTWLYHTQLDDLASLADAFPNTRIIVNHMGGLIGVANYRTGRSEQFALWRSRMADLARRDNVHVKVGGMGMPVFGFGFEQGGEPALSEALAKAWRPLVEVCLESFGAQRCMFESNFPVDKQSCSYVSLWNAFKLLSRSLSTDERKDLFYRTACRSYQLAELEARCERSV